MDETSKFIKSVTYHLDPTFRPKDIKVSQAPFLLSRNGWGVFDVEFDVEFQPWTELGTKKFIHELCFKDKGKTHTFIIDVDLDKDPSKDEKALTAEALAKQIEKLTVKGNL